MRAKRTICLMLLALAMSTGCGAMGSPGRYDASFFATEKVDGPPRSLTGRQGEPSKISEDHLAAFNAAVALVTDLKYAEAEAAFLAMIPQLESSGAWTQAAEAIFWLGFCQEKDGRGDQARATYQRLQRVYPGTPAATQAAERLKRLAAPPPRE